MDSLLSTIAGHAFLLIVVLLCSPAAVHALSLVPPSRQSAPSQPPPIVPLQKTAANSIVPQVVVLSPKDSFRTTRIGQEVSVVSLNVLAPSLRFLGHSSHENQIPRLIQQDRRSRIPKALAMAKQRNADILCLQEVEGGNEPLDSFLQQQLQSEEQVTTTTLSTTTASSIQGYDRHVWAPLHPNRADDCVGLCVAWRSDRFVLLQNRPLYARGHVVQLRETATDAIVTLINLHLPARPSAIGGRLQTIANAVQRLEGMLQTTTTTTTTTSPLHGLVVVTGDWNSDAKSPAVQLLQRGRMESGSIQDRAYRTTVTKQMAHKWRSPRRHGFENVYQCKSQGKNQQILAGPATAAPITVSLTGRAPAIVDHMFYTTANLTATHTKPVRESLPQSSGGISRRMMRRRRAAALYQPAATSSSVSAVPTRLKMESVLATIGGPTDSDAYVQQRQAIIEQGLPNEEEGFYSDHLPIGALFVPTDATASYDRDIQDIQTKMNANINTESLDVDVISKNRNFEQQVSLQEPEAMTPDITIPANNRNLYRKKTTSGLSGAAQQRRAAYTASTSIRRRHNAILGTITGWLIDRGATDVLRDQPLRKWKWLLDHIDESNKKSDGINHGLNKKSRAPDLCCVLSNKKGKFRVIVEVTATDNPDKIDIVRGEKMQKYQDLMDMLAATAGGESDDKYPTNSEAIFVIVMDGSSGAVPTSTLEDLHGLAMLSCSENGEDISREVARIEELLLNCV